MDTARQRPSPESESGDLGDFDIAVVGAGQAGLAIGYFLARQSRRFVILEAGESIGQAWRTRWNSLVLFTSRRYSGLPGLPFPGDPEGYATRDEVLAYLEQYAATFNLPLRLGTPVRRLGHAAAMTFRPNSKSGYVKKTRMLASFAFRHLRAVKKHAAS